MVDYTDVLTKGKVENRTYFVGYALLSGMTIIGKSGDYQKKNIIGQTTDSYNGWTKPIPQPHRLSMPTFTQSSQLKGLSIQKG